MKTEDIDNIFTYHPPFGSQQERYVAIRDKAKELAHLVNNSCPESREKSLALTNLQQSVQMANASIAIHEKPYLASEMMEAATMEAGSGGTQQG